MRFFLILCAFLTGLAAIPVQAEETLVKSGQTVLNISASETETVQQDMLLASLRYEIDSKDVKTLQDKINTVMAKALEIAKKHPEVSATTDNYYVYPYDPNQLSHPDPEERIEDHEKNAIIWRGSQGLQLKGTNSAELLKLMGELQVLGMQTSNLSYTLSPELFEQHRDALLESALKKLTEKANRAAKALGKREAELVEVNVDTGYPQPPMPMMAYARAEGAMAKSDMAAPVSSPGESQITLTVSARAVLK